MPISRVYTASPAQTAATVAIDFFELIAPSTSGIVLLGVDISQISEVGDAQEELVGFQVRRATGAYTSGSGGTTATPVPLNTADPSSVVTVEVMNTTQAAVGSGAISIIHRGAFNVRAGLQMWWPPECYIACRPSEALIISAISAPADSITYLCTVYFAETS